jgi:hypothetical protein
LIFLSFDEFDRLTPLSVNLSSLEAHVVSHVDVHGACHLRCFSGCPMALAAFSPWWPPAWVPLASAAETSWVDEGGNEVF